MGDRAFWSRNKNANCTVEAMPQCLKEWIASGILIDTGKRDHGVIVWGLPSFAKNYTYQQITDYVEAWKQKRN